LLKQPPHRGCRPEGSRGAAEPGSRPAAKGRAQLWEFIQQRIPETGARFGVFTRIKWMFRPALHLPSLLREAEICFSEPAICCRLPLPWAPGAVPAPAGSPCLWERKNRAGLSYRVLSSPLFLSLDSMFNATCGDGVLCCAYSALPFPRAASARILHGNEKNLTCSFLGATKMGRYGAWQRRVVRAGCGAGFPAGLRADSPPAGPGRAGPLCGTLGCGCWGLEAQLPCPGDNAPPVAMGLCSCLQRVSVDF